MEFVNFEPDKKGANNSIAKINFDIHDYFNELIGGLSVEAKKYIGIKFIDDYFLTYGDDGGFSKENIEMFRKTHISNDYGIGSHGIGLRATLNNFLNKCSDSRNSILEDYCIISNNSDIGFKTIVLRVDRTNQEDFNLKYCIRNTLEKEINFFNKHIENFGTLFFLPNVCKYIPEGDIIQYKIIEKYNKLLSFRICNNNLNFEHDYMNREVDNREKHELLPFFNSHIDFKANTEFCIKDVDVIIFSGKPENSSSSGLKKYALFSKQLFFIDTKLETENFVLNISEEKYHKPNEFSFTKIKPLYKFSFNFCNLVDNNLQDKHRDKYGFKNFSHDIGCWVSYKGILINNEAFGVGKRGETEPFYSPLFLFNQSNKNDIIKTEANKSKLNLGRLDDPVKNIFKWLKTHSKSYYLKKYCKNKIENLKEKIPDDLKENLWIQQFNSLYKGKCACCDGVITPFNRKAECGHIKSEHNGGAVDIKNLLWVCKTCNCSMGTKNMLEYVNYRWGEKHERYTNIINLYIKLDKNYEN
jgi:hypothetical protein